MIRLLRNSMGKRLLSQQYVAIERCGILFPGEGVQYVGMCRELLLIPGVEELFEEAEAVLNQKIKKMCLEGPQEELNRTINSQPAIMIASLAALKKLETDEPQAYDGITVAAGFSLGQLTTLVASGTVSLKDGLHLVQASANIMQRASDTTAGAVLSVWGLDDNKLNQLCHESKNYGEVLTIANYLFPGGRVVAGSLSSIERLEKAALLAGSKAVKRIPVSGAFHSSLMEDAAEEYKETINQIQLHRPKFSIYSNMTGLPYEPTDETPDMLARHLCEPVLWEQSMRHMLSNFALTSIYELGPKRQLRSTLQRIDPGAAAKLVKNIEA